MKQGLTGLIPRSLMAGVFIGFGVITYTLVENHILGSLLFSLGLLSVILQGEHLYTGKVGYLFDGLFKPSELFVIILPLNIIGIYAICSIFASCSGYDFSYATEIIANKSNEIWYEALLRSIGCGAMMYLAVDNFKEFRNPLCVILPVMTFILCGFDHCIANFGYMALAGTFLWKEMIIWIIGNALGSLVVNYMH